MGDRGQDVIIAPVYLGNVEILSEKRCLLRGNLPALVGQDLAEGQQSVLRLAQGEGLPTNCEVDVVLGQRPAPLFVHLHGLTVTAQRVPPLNGNQWRADEGNRRLSMMSGIRKKLRLHMLHQRFCNRLFKQAYLPRFAVTMTSQDHMEGKLAHHGVTHTNKAVGSLFQQQSTTQVRVLWVGHR